MNSKVAAVENKKRWNIFFSPLCVCVSVWVIFERDEEKFKRQDFPS